MTGNHEMTMDDDQLRASVKTVGQMIGYDSLLTLCQRAGLPVYCEKGTLADYANHRNNVNLKLHTSKLTEFFHSHPMGLFLLGKSEHPHGVIDAITKATHRSHRRPSDPDLDGTYLTYHGAHIRPDHFVVRSLQIQTTPEGFTTYSVYFIDTVAVTTHEYETAGTVVLVADRPQFLSFHRDNAVGLMLIVGQKMTVCDGRLHDVTGAFMGMNHHGQHYTRATFIQRYKGPEKHARELLRRTGIKKLADWDRPTQEIFRRLAEGMPEQPCPDPLLALRK